MPVGASQGVISKFSVQNPVQIAASRADAAGPIWPQVLYVLLCLLSSLEADQLPPGGFQGLATIPADKELHEEQEVRGVHPQPEPRVGVVDRAFPTVRGEAESGLQQRERAS